jgi:hypothetical protein
MEDGMFDLFVCGVTIVNATPQQCFDLISDAEGFKDWDFFEESVRIQDGKHDLNGVGSVRKFSHPHTGDVVEVINFYDPPRLFGYRIVNDAVVKDHQGIITINPIDGGTELRWYMTAKNNGMFEGDDDDIDRQMKSLMESTVSRIKATVEARAGTATAV